MKKESLFALAFFAALIFGGYGITLGAFVIVGFMGVLMAIADYFGTRDRSRPPSTAERVFAYLWIWIRRAVCWLAGGAFVYRGAYGLISSEVTGEAPSWWVRLFTILLGVFLIYVGFVGQGNTRSALQDDVKLHKENKRRYKLWF